MRFKIGKFSIGASFNSGRFTGGVNEGRVHLYASATFGDKTWFVTRWDIDRSKTKRYFSLDGVMCVNWGSFELDGKINKG